MDWFRNRQCDPNSIPNRLTRIEAKLDLLINRETKLENRIMPAIDNLTAEVANNTQVEQSAVTLLQGLKTALDAAIASGDMSQVQALSDQLAQNDTALAAAIVANTPAAPGGSASRAQ